MSDFDPTPFIIIGPVILLGAILFFALVRFMTTRRWNQHKAATVLKWEAEGVNFVRGPVGGQFGGLESMGVNRVIRGIGLAVLTDRDVRVTRSAPEAAWIVSFRQIKGVALRSAFLGQRGKAPFIVIRFVKDGAADKLAFKVTEHETWANEIAEAAGVSLRDEREE